MSTLSAELRALADRVDILEKERDDAFARIAVLEHENGDLLDDVHELQTNLRVATRVADDLTTEAGE